MVVRRQPRVRNTSARVPGPHFFRVMRTWHLTTKCNTTTVVSMETTQRRTPNNHFHPCCGRRNVLPHAPHCWTRDQADAAELAQCGPVELEKKPDVLVVTGGTVTGRAALRRQWVARVLVAFHPAEVQEDTSHGQGATVVFRFPLSGHVAKVAYAEHDPSDVVAEIKRRGLVGEP